MKLRDVDSAETAYRLRAGSYALIVGVVSAGVATMLAGPAGVVIGVVIAAFVYLGTLYIAERSGRAAASIYHTSGSSTPAVREYSLADSFVARGMIPQALAEYESLANQYTADPEPLLRKARVLRNNVRDYEAALTDYRRVLGIDGLKPETELATLREITELCTHKLQEPPRALPFLARISEKFRGTPTAEWARNEVASIKAAMQQERKP